MAARGPRAVRGWLPSALLVLAIAWLAAATVPAFVGLYTFVVVSASMSPAIPPGAVVVVNPADRATLRPGDVGTFVDRAGAFRVTHRVVEVVADTDGTPAYRTKGDASLNTDGELRRPEYTLGRVMYSVPFVGYISFGLREPRYWLGLLAVLAALLVASVVRTVRRARPRPRNVDATPRIQLAGLVGAGVGAALAAFAVGVALAALAPLAWGWHPFTMADTTMGAAVPRGALVMTEPIHAAQAAPGEVIAYMPSVRPGTVVIHRVATVVDGAATGTRTKGDALGELDPWVLAPDQSVGRMVYVLPLLGDVLAFAGSRGGMALAALVVLGLVVLRARAKQRELTPVSPLRAADARPAPPA